MSRFGRALGLSVAVAMAAACAGPPVLSPIEDEPVCADFELGAAKNPMRGSLKYPVEVRVLDGDRVAQSKVLIGKRTKDQRPPAIQLLDDDEEYVVEWVQCGNLRAPTPLLDNARKSNVTEYKCVDGKVYETEKLVTVKGDIASHTLKVPTPPNPECWTTSEIAGEGDDEKKDDEKKDEEKDEKDEAEESGTGGSGSDDTPDDAASAKPAASASAAPKAEPPPAKPPKPAAPPPAKPPKPAAPPQGAAPPGPMAPSGEDTYE